MNIREKIQYLSDKHFGEWFTERQKVTDKISNSQDIWCVCGRLATGLHENSCRKLQNKINSETAKKLEHLIKCQ